MTPDLLDRSLSPPARTAGLSPRAGIAGLSPAIVRGLTGIVVARLSVNGGIRVVYPFLPAIAHGLGVSFEVLAVLVASRSLAGLAGPVLARTVPADRQRAFMVASQAMVLVGSLLIASAAIAPTSLRTMVAGVGFLTTGVARPMFDLPMQTWVSGHVAPADRGRALGVTELGWALSLAATVPVAGVLIERIGWHSPFVLVAAMAATGMVALLVAVPADAAGARRPALVAAPADGARARTPLPLRRGVAQRWTSASMAMCGGAALAVAAGESVLVVYGEWLSRDFGMSIAQIGASTLLIVAAELIGEGLVVTLSDRVGLARTLFSALLVSATAYGALGMIGGHVTLAVAAIGTLFIAFEVTVVVLIAFASTVVHRTPERARLLGALMAAVACGNAAGAVLAPVIFALGGIALSGVAAACTVAVAAALLWRGAQPNPAYVH